MQWWGGVGWAVLSESPLVPSHHPHVCTPLQSMQTQRPWKQLVPCTTLGLFKLASPRYVLVTFYTLEQEKVRFP